MNQPHFDQLVKGVRDMKRHMAGKRFAVQSSQTWVRPTVHYTRKWSHSRGRID